MKNVIFLIIGVTLLLWFRLELYRNQQLTKHEDFMNKQRLEHEAREVEKDLQHDSIEREKDRELQREIMKKKEESNPN